MLIYVNDNIIDKCSPRGSEVCKNGGKCVIENDGAVKCNCTNEYQGAHCEVGKIQTTFYKNVIILLLTLRRFSRYY